MFCKKCGHNKDQGTRCKNCQKNWRQQYLLENKEVENKRALDYYYKNQDKVKNYKIENRDKIRAYNNEYEKNRKQNDPAFKLRKNCSRLIKHALNGIKNNLSILKYLPYTMEDLKKHLESQFDNKMSWNNYGTYWHIDHIYPQSLLPYTSMSDENFNKCWDLNNLRPLEALENIRKSNKIVGLNVY